jgi:uncharacterized integral membrane protein
VADELPTASRQGRGARFWTIVVIAVLGLIFIFQNSQKVDVKFFFSTTNVPLVFALLLAALVGFIIGLALPRFRRRGD